MFYFILSRRLSISRRLASQSLNAEALPQHIPSLIASRGQTVPFGTDIIFKFRGMDEYTVACEICEDLWVPNPPSVSHALNGATVMVNLSASDEAVAKDEYRKALVANQSARLVCGYVYACSAARMAFK